MLFPGKLSENHLHAWLFWNPCWQVLRSIKSRGQISPQLLRRKRTCPHRLENNHACKWILDNFPIIHVSEFLENFHKSIYMHGCSPIHVERYESLLELHGVHSFKAWSMTYGPVFILCFDSFDKKFILQLKKKKKFDRHFPWILKLPIREVCSCDRKQQCSQFSVFVYVP